MTLNSPLSRFNASFTSNRIGRSGLSAGTKSSSLTVVNRGSCISSIPRIVSTAKDHEHDIHNARPSNPVYTGSKFNSLLGCFGAPSPACQFAAQGRDVERLGQETHAGYGCADIG